MANSFPGSGLAYADAFSVGTSGQQNASLYVCSSCVRSAVIENTYAQTNLHHNTLWLRQNNSSGCNYSSIGFTVINNGGDHHRANIVATGNSGTTGGNLALYTRNNSGPDTLGLYIDHAGNVGINTTSPTAHNGSNAFIIQGGGGGRAIMELWDGTSGKSVFQNVGGDTYIGQLCKGTGAGDVYLLTGGNGTSANVSMILKCNGNVGIATSSPNSCTRVQIDVAGSGCYGLMINKTDANESTIRFKSTHGCGSDYRIGASIYVDSAFEIAQQENGCSRFVIRCTGNVGIGTYTPSYRLHVNGTFYAAGSSQDYKQSICNYNTDSCMFMKLKPVTYQYKEEYCHLGKELKSGTQIGLIAEEVAESHPELAILVNEEDNKVVRNVDYEKLTIILLSELQKLRQEVDQLKNK